MFTYGEELPGDLCLRKPGCTGHIQSTFFHRIRLISFLFWGRWLERPLGICIKGGAVIETFIGFPSPCIPDWQVSLVYEIDWTLEDELLLLGTFLDIEVAFDITGFEPM
jgi:hypothetical protein